jgi:hypothetical protein
MIGRPHDAPLCADCLDTGRITDPRSADEDGAPDTLPCPRRDCIAREEAEMLRGLDHWKCTLPVDERELEAERAAVLDELDNDGERCPLCARRRAREVTSPLEEGDDLSW